ncbi:HET-domain-containing protein, partial [Cucurbitaria berberidis CBS 394.84]
MRLLQLHDDGKFSLAEYLGNNIPRYAILSHTWGSDNEEVTYQNLLHSTGNDKIGFRKLTFCGNQAKKDGLQHFWVDTCCIDKSSSAELSEAINSMFRWYQKAERCYVYMADVSRCNVDGDGDSSQRWKPAFRQSRWFTRGWTLQELIAPGSTEFFCREETYLGNKRSLEQTIHEITGIAIGALRGDPLSQYSIDERLSWGARRKTKREEDEAYCLLGILGVYMSLIYGEGQENAFARLEEQ